MAAMVRRILSLILTVQLLTTQQLACHCHAAADLVSAGSTPHLHLSSLLGSGRAREHGHSHAGHSHHDHDHSDEAPPPASDDGPEDRPGDEPENGHDSDAYRLPDGWYAKRASVRPFGGPFNLALMPPDVFHMALLAAVAYQACDVPPDPEPPGLPLYLRTLRLLV